MELNPSLFIESADLGKLEGVQLETSAAPLNLDQLPPGVVSGTTLIDFSAVASPSVRAGVSLAMLFASRMATKALKEGDDEDDWLATYTSSLAQLGFSIAGMAVTESRFRKTGVRLHKAIIPFLTVAFGGGTLGPIILAGLKNLEDIDAQSPWIALFDREARRFNAREMHFAAVSSNDAETSIRYAIARLNVDVNETNILFFKITDASARFESSTTTMSANNGLLAMLEPQLRQKLAHLSSSFIAAADL